MIFKFLNKNLSVSNLSLMLKATSGRNLTGKISAYHRGGGHAKRYRILLNLRIVNTSAGVIRCFDYDPIRKTYLALICFKNGELGYIIPTKEMSIGDLIYFTHTRSGYSPAPVHLIKKLTTLSFKIHFFDFLGNFEVGSTACNIFGSSKFLKYSTAAGTSSKVLKKLEKSIVLKLPSNKLCLVSKFYLGFSGSIAFPESKFIFLTKAGQSRFLGYKPHVRGVAKNPVDHPHGGGEGKTSGGRCSVSPWGILTKGYPTVRGKRRKINRLAQRI